MHSTHLNTVSTVYIDTTMPEAHSAAPSFHTLTLKMNVWIFFGDKFGIYDENHPRKLFQKYFFVNFYFNFENSLYYCVVCEALLIVREALSVVQ